MSFKREGNDSNLLETLRRRRIKDLFSEDIPEDEAKLLCNGRLTCTVCPNYPIFDTATMLAMHRNGKKHLHNLQIFEDKKEELKQLIAVRKHQQYLKDGTTSIEIARGIKSDGLSTASPYDPRIRKFKVRLGDRRPKLDLTEPNSITKNLVTSTSTSIVTEKTGSKHPPLKKSKGKHLNLSETCPPGTVTKASLSRHKHSCDSTWKDVHRRQLEGPVIHDSHLKNIFKKKSFEPVRLKPYQSTTGRVPDIIHFHSEDKKLSDSSKGSYQLAPETSALTASTNQSNKTSDLTDLQHSKSGSKIPTVQGCSTTTQNIDEKNQMAEKYRLLQGSGWKRDWDGKWVKDEDAEFDSDEEPPDIP